MTPIAARSLASFAAALTLIGCGDGRADREGAGPVAAQGDGAPTDVSAEAKAYVAQFTQKDPEACFANDVALKQPDLKGPAVPGPGAAPTRVIVMIDGSGSMAGRMGGRSKLELAREAALGFVSGLPASVPASLLVFGQQGDNSPAGKPKSCAAIDVLAPMSADRARLRTALGEVRAVGWTPLASGLDRAEALLAASDTPGEQVIYVVSDGEETCGGDPVAAARRINSGRTRAIVNVIGFNLPPAEAAKLTAVAGAGGGAFVNVANAAEFARARAQMEAARRTVNHIATAGTTSANHLATAGAISRTHVCVTGLISQEHLAMAADLSKRQIAGQPLSFREEAEALMKARHDALEAKDEAYAANLTNAEAAAKQRIDAAAEAVR